MTGYKLCKPLDPRLGLHVVAKDGTFHGKICNIYTDDNNVEFYAIKGYSHVVRSKGTFNDIRPDEVMYGKE